MRLGSLGAPELILIVVAIMLVFGTSKLGDLGGAVGKSVRDFKKATTQDDDAKKTTLAGETVVTTTQEPVIVNGTPAERTTTTAEKVTPVGLGDYRPSDTKPL